MSKVMAVPDQALVDPITIFPDICTGCNLCLHVCPVDLFLPNEEKGGPPLVLYPGSAGTKAAVWTSVRSRARSCSTALRPCASTGSRAASASRGSGA